MLIRSVLAINLSSLNTKANFKNNNFFIKNNQTNSANDVFFTSNKAHNNSKLVCYYACLLRAQVPGNGHLQAKRNVLN